MEIPTKTKKKSNEHGSGNAYFQNSVHLFVVADDICFVKSGSVTDKVNIEETNTVWAESLPKDRRTHWHGWTSR